MKSELDRKVDEFCAKGNLFAYNATLEVVFNAVINSNCNISARYDGGPSLHEYSDGRSHCLIRIDINKFKDSSPVCAIWTILHEFGHHFAEKIKKSDMTNSVILQREKDAWGYARMQVLLLTELNDKLDDFEKFAGKCLDSYRNL